MKISSYNMELNSSSTFQKTESQQVSLTRWVDSPKSSTSNQSLNGIVLDLSEEGKTLAAQTFTFKNTDEVCHSADAGDQVSDEADHKQRLISDFIYILTGRRLKFVNIKLQDIKNPSGTMNTNSTIDANAQVSQVNQRVGWGIDLNYKSSYSEESRVSFSAKGTIQTSDGREIDLQFNLNMSRSFYTQTNISFKAGDALLDPLVINLSTTPLSLSGKKISFDINIDGNKENISLPSNTSGFLVLDKNNNGSIDDGSELFGPQSGNGFEELSEYDSDNNGWLDENDSIYNDLQIWQHDDSGKASLIALGKAGVGAIYLDSANTDFKYADTQNNTQGFLRQTGIYLRENGTTGTIQHIDLSI